MNKWLQHGWFPLNIWKFQRTYFFYRTPPVAASDAWWMIFMHLNQDKVYFMYHVSFCWVFTWFIRMTSSKYKIKDSGVFVRPLFDSYDLNNFTSLNFRFRLVLKNLHAHKIFLKFQISNFSCNFLKAVLRKIYLVHSWILCLN